MKPDFKMKVLVFGMSNRRAGTEAVIENIAGGLKGKGFAFDYVCEEPLACDTPATIGSRCFVVPPKRRHPFRYRRAMKKLFDEHAHEYDAVWTNLNSLSNIDPLIYAKGCGISKRVVHAHNSRFLANPIQNFLSFLHRKKLQNFSTDLVACSQEAGAFFFGEAPFYVLRNAIDPTKYGFSERSRRRVRCEYGVEGDEKLIGTVGRLSSQKNQKYLIDVMPRILQLNSRVKLMIVGDGELLSSLKLKCKTLGISDHVIFAGSQAEVRDYLSAFDVFAFPSLFEGLGVALVEAQANGLPCVASDGVPAEARASGSVYFASLNDESEWVERLLSLDRSTFFENTDLMSRFDLADTCDEFATILVGGDCANPARK